MSNKNNKKKERKRNDLAEIDDLIARTREPITDLTSLKFSELPISSKTMEGLKGANFVEMTEIQKKALPIALCGKDILAAAKTGSGKTLAFLIPLLEKLYVNKWGPQDGLGALVISPTRELAVQIFEVLRKIGKYHSFSAGLIIGGKDFKAEKLRVQKMNILIGTPGRLLQHMDESSSFDAQNLQLLVLDEADRILDMGFSKTVNSIIEFLPPYRQTFLFSATQTKSVRDLSRLSLQSPEYVGVHEKAEFSTPEGLTQYYMTIDLDKKLDTLFSFIKTHLKTKAIVFMSSCKQVNFTFETFCKMQPGVPLLHLHGRQNQTKRVEMFEKFRSMPEAYLFCTDIAARGLDFPAVDWVIQVDCPEDAETYIHRVGRTARYEAKGSALLFLLPSEEKVMAESLENSKIPITKIAPNKSQVQSIQPLLQSYCFKHSEIKYLAQKTFMSYMRSTYLQKNKKVFDVMKLPAEAFAASLGLSGMPQIKFLKKSEKKSKEAASSAIDEPEIKEKAKPRTKVEKLFAKKNHTVLAEHYTKLVDQSDSDNEDFMTIKRTDHELEGATSIGLTAEEAKALTKRQTQKLKQNAIKNAPKGQKLMFDDEGMAHSLYELEDGVAFVDAVDVKAVQKEHFDAEQQKLEQEDVLDKGVAKEKKRAKILKRKAQASQDHDGVQVTLGPNSDNYESNSASCSDSDSDSQSSASSIYKRATSKPVNNKPAKRAKIIETDQPDTLEDQEALALKLLGGDF